MALTPASIQLELPAPSTQTQRTRVKKGKHEVDADVLIHVRGRAGGVARPPGVLPQRAAVAEEFGVRKVRHPACNKSARNMTWRDGEFCCGCRGRCHLAKKTMVPTTGRGLSEARTVGADGTKAQNHGRIPAIKSTHTQSILCRHTHALIHLPPDLHRPQHRMQTTCMIPSWKVM